MHKAFNIKPLKKKILSKPLVIRLYSVGKFKCVVMFWGKKLQISLVNI